jgi:hypothetical protein
VEKIGATVRYGQRSAAAQRQGVVTAVKTVAGAVERQCGTGAGVQAVVATSDRGRSQATKDAVGVAGASETIAAAANARVSVEEVVAVFAVPVMLA